MCAPEQATTQGSPLHFEFNFNDDGNDFYALTSTIHYFQHSG